MIGDGLGSVLKAVEYITNTKKCQRIHFGSETSTTFVNSNLPLPFSDSILTGCQLSI